jgi:hypothetical protein
LGIAPRPGDGPDVDDEPPLVFNNVTNSPIERVECPMVKNDGVMGPSMMMRPSWRGHSPKRLNRRRRRKFRFPRAAYRAETPWWVAEFIVGR